MFIRLLQTLNLKDENILDQHQSEQITNAVSDWVDSDNRVRANGGAEKIRIDDFLEQINDLRTVDFVQFHLGESFTSSPVHMAPHEVLESLWQGDMQGSNPRNLVVPRMSTGFDPFLDALEKTKAAGMRTMVYVNTANMLYFWRRNAFQGAGPPDRGDRSEKDPVGPGMPGSPGVPGLGTFETQIVFPWGQTQVWPHFLSAGDPVDPAVEKVCGSGKWPVRWSECR